MKLIPKTLKRETIDRKSLMKLHWCQGKDVRSLSKLILTPPKVIKEKKAVFKTVLNVELLWHTSGIFRKAERQRPRLNWNGFVDQLISEKTNSPNGFVDQLTSEKKNSSKSTITMLPLTDLNPRDENCMYSTLIHIPEEY